MPGVKPVFNIWSAKLGQPVSQIPNAEVVNLACGTDGGPPSLPLDKPADFTKCQPEKSGLREVYFQYDDEQKYIALALGLNEPAVTAGTSMYGHPVIVSVLVDSDAIVRGIRVVTDQHASDFQRRSLYDLAHNLQLQFKSWNLDCQDIPPHNGEQSIGKLFVHTVCTGANATLGDRLRIESRYYRRKGEETLDPVTRKVVANNYQSSARFELVQMPYEPVISPAL